MTSAAHAQRDASPAAPSAALTYTPEQAAAIIGADCKASWLKQGAREGRFPCTWLGKYAFTAAQISEILAICAVQPKKHAKPAATPAAPASPKRTAPSPLQAPATGVTQLRAREPRKRSA